MAQQKKTIFTTEKGVAMYPWLNKADFQFDSAGQFKVNLKMSQDNAKELVDAVKEVAKSEFGAKAANARMPFKNDPDTGDLIVVTKSKFKPKFVDSSGQLISENNVPPIHGGSTLRLQGNIYPYVAGGQSGVSLQLSGVQIIELADGNNNGVSFSAQEGGYVASNDNHPEAANDNTQDGGEQYNF